MKKSKKPKYFLSSFAKGLSIINSFTSKTPQFTLSEIAKVNRMSLGTATRYLMTLKYLGYVHHDNLTRTYSLAPKTLSLGFGLLGSMDLRTRTLPHMIAIAKQLNVTAQCAILEGTEILYIERIRSSDVVNLDLTTGSRLPAYCTALGKAILAFMDLEEANKIIRKMKMEQHTPYTIANKEAFLKELELTRQRGYAINQQELTIGLCTYAVPLYKYGKVEAALGLSFPCYRVKDEETQNNVVNYFHILKSPQPFRQRHTQ